MSEFLNYQRLFDMTAVGRHLGDEDDVGEQ